MRIALCQMNPTVGAVAANAAKLLNFAKQASSQGASLLIAPELVLTGYPPQDILFRQELLDQVERELLHLAERSPIPIIAGAPVRRGNQAGMPLWNAAVFCHQGKVQVAARKTLLPNYNVFDERRYFEPAQEKDGPNWLEIDGTRFGISICEDAWNDEQYWPQRRYRIDPVARLIADQAQVLINISASPFAAGKLASREDMLAHLASRYRRPLLMVSQVGANDHMIFDGSSVAINTEGKVVSRAAAFKEELLVVDLKTMTGSIAPILGDMEFVVEALCLGIRDYIAKCGAPGVLVGMSGGIDSSVVTALAVRALGPQRVVGVRMPSRFTTTMSGDDAQMLATNLGIEQLNAPIEDLVQGLRNGPLKMKAAEPKCLDIADQNSQARIRGVILMALSNCTGQLVLSTSNKSEVACGYTTLYGDMCGALAPLADVYKTDVWAMARFLNAEREIIPQRVIERPPTAELKEGQADQDVLPPYHELDPILVRFIEADQPVTQIIQETGLDPQLVRKVVELVCGSQYKRKQAPIGLMVSERSFDGSYRWPIAKRFNLL